MTLEKDHTVLNEVVVQVGFDVLWVVTMNLHISSDKQTENTARKLARTQNGPNIRHCQGLSISLYATNKIYAIQKPIRMIKL